MRNTFLIFLIVLFFSGCKKDKFTSVPQIKFNTIERQVWLSTNTVIDPGPLLKLQLTDLEGDFGFQDNKDTSYVYVKNITIAPFKIDSLKFPKLSLADRKNLNAEISVDLKSVLARSNRTPPYIDSLYFEVYVVDFAKNKSNVIKTEKPVLYVVK